ncbi:hypothetical protein, variant [Verruconis gallopava]|nr:hypothetical protein, variant [Verruconis gallopava]KIW04347.1 hypothetical protein, variant [Verruconis gallopava]
MESALKKFVNVDGDYGRKLVPFPHDPHYNPEVFKFDQMSFADRFKEIEEELTPLERANFEGFLSITSGGTMEESSFFEFIRWWALNNYDIRNFFELCLTFKFRSGQSAFARKFFDEASSTGRMSWQFNTPVAAIENTRTSVTVTTRAGQQYRARRAVCTVPLNVLHKINFSPALSSAKLKASKTGHCNKVSKVHVECKNPELRSFSATAFPHNKLTYTFGDGTTPAGNTHLVAFGSSLPGVQLNPEEKIEDTIEAFQEFAPMDVKRLVFHNWTKDEFADGAWEFLKPDMIKYLDALRERQGNTIFASADWALGWRGFIDGAIEDGTRAAMEIKTELADRLVKL